MARKNIEDFDTKQSTDIDMEVDQDSLEELVTHFFLVHKQELDFKKLSAADNKRIKELMTADKKLLVKNSDKKDNRIYVTKGGLQAEYYCTVSKTLGQEEKVITDTGLIEFLKSHGYNKAIKTVEVVNEEELEKMLYAGVITEEHMTELAKFENSVDTPKLSVKKVKEK